MADSFEMPDDFHEAYEVVRTFELHSNAGHFRIEIVRGLRGSANGEFAAHYYKEMNHGPWAPLLGPGWVASKDADTAVHQAMAFLEMHLAGAIKAGSDGP